MSDAIIGSFDDIEEVEFVKFDEGSVCIKFASSEFLIKDNAYQNKCYEFSVMEEEESKILSVTSKRLMLKLKEHHPLVNKMFEIERIGSGMETDYTVDLVK